MTEKKEVQVAISPAASNPFSPTASKPDQKLTGDVKGAEALVASVNDAPTKKELRLARAIRILRATQNTLTAALSLAIVVFQGKAYYDFQNTQNVTGAWPPAAFVAPTIILFTVALAALLFDLCLLVAYMFPGHSITAWAVSLATNLYWVVATGKTAAYAVTAVVCRSGYTYGNSSGTNADLWSWTCSKRASDFGSVNNAATNCQTQSLAWYFSLANIGIETIGFIVDRLVARQTQLAKDRGSTYIPGQMGDEEIAKLETMRMAVSAEVGQYSPDAKS